jgi:hypothetical protein
MPEEVTIDRRFRGPPESANGGWAAGLLAARIDAGAVEVTLRAPPPLDIPLQIAVHDDGSAELRDRDLLVADGHGLDDVGVDVPDPVSPAQAAAASAGSPLHSYSPYPECFVCGPAREHGDGYRAVSGPVEGRDLVASIWEVGEWVPHDDNGASTEATWAALDCPSGIAPITMTEELGPCVLGRMAARVLRPARIGESCVTMGWTIERDGRKVLTGSAAFAPGDELIGYSLATWIELSPGQAAAITA